MTANAFVPKLLLTLPSPDFPEHLNNNEGPFNSTPVSYFTNLKNDSNGFKNEDEDFSFCVPKEKGEIASRKLLSVTDNGDDDSSSIYENGHGAQDSIPSAIEVDDSLKQSLGGASVWSNHSFYMKSSHPLKNLQGASYTDVTPFSPLPLSPISCKSDTTEQVQRMRRKVNKMKGELEVERLRNSRLQSSHAQELQNLKTKFEDEKWQISVSDIAHSELERVTEQLRREKDKELKEVFKYKDEEVKQLKRLFALEKDDSIRVALEIQAQEMRKRDGLTYVRTVQKLKEEIRLLRSLNRTLERHYQMKCEQDDEKSRQLNQIKEEFRAEFCRMLSSSKLVSLREVDKMRHLERSLFGEESSLLDDSDNHSLPSVSCASREKSESYRETSKLNSSKEFPENDCSRSELVNKRLFDEKEKPLQKKVGDLQTQVQKLERKTMLLKTENDALKKKQEDHKSRQEKLKSLRKRNTELAGIAQRLELKAKILQQQNLEKSDDGDHVKKLRQRTRDNTAHAKTLLEKEKEIEDLKKNYKELAEKISNMQSNLPQNLHLYEEQEELESIIKQAAKERLQLEKQLVKAKMATQTQVASCEVNGENGKTNLFVDVQKDKLQQTLKQLADLEKSNQELQAKLSLLETCDKTKEMEKELQETQSRNTQLEENVNVLEKQVKQIEMVNEECKTLKESLAQQENKCLLAKEQVSALESKINSLELVIKDLKKSSSRLKTLEKEHELTFQQLKKKQDEVRTLQEEKDAAQSQHEESVQALMSKLMELEHKYQMQEMKQKELNLELVLLQEQKHLVGSPGGRKSDKRSLSQNSLDGSQNQRSAQNMNRSSGRLLADGRLPALIDSGQLQVYIAKYNYDPFQFSPNENPEAELPLSSGDYVFISGEMDEDGFFEGELIDGKKGLVPSNFVEKVPDVDLIDFPSILVASGHHSDDSVLANLAVQQDLEFNSSDESEQMSAVLSLPDDKPLVLPNPDSVGDLGDIEEVEEDSSSLHLSLTDYPDFISEDKQTESFFPRKLNLDRQLTNSLLISWLAPEIPRNTVIISYQIFVDGEFKTTIKGNERTKALLENVDSKQIHRVTVVCVTTRSRSAHQQCSLLVGKAAVPTPTDLKVSHISANGALLSWWPGNTNYQHVVSVNDQEMRVVNPGVYEYLLTGLAPATSHRVTIRAKSLLANFEEERNKDRKELLTARIEFKTLAGGLPDPPLDVQVEVGPQEGTILLTWLPVTINRSGISPSGVIKGYSIYADDKLIKNVMGPINDHVLLSSANFSGFIPQRLTVRTMDDHGEESVDSQGVILPPNLLKEMAATTAKNIAYEAVAARKHEHERDHEHSTYEDKQEDCTNDTDEEIEAAFRACDKGVTTKKVPPDRSPYRSPIRRPSNKSNEKSENRVAQHGMPIPQIEITRDSSTERGNSLEDEDFNLQKHKTSTEDKGKIITRKKSDATGAENYRPPNNNPVPKPEPVVDEFPGNPSEPWRTMITPDRVSSSPSLAKARSHAVVALNSDPYYEDAEDNLQRRIRVVMDPDPMRLFVALFDYDPAVMSPNADACDAELPFREGQVIKIFGDCDSDGFYKGECNGQVGYVPCNMVTEVKVDDPDVVQQLLKESSSTSSGDSSSTPAKENFPSNSLYMSSGLPVASDQLGPGKHMVALYDYDPQELSPNVDSEAELAFKMGDQVIIYGDMDDDGFFIGEVKGKKGLVPSNFIREADTPDEEIERASVTQSQSRDSIPSPNIDEEVSRGSSVFSSRRQFDPQDQRT